MKKEQRHEPPRWVRSIRALNVLLSQDLFGGPHRLKLAWAINLHKALTPVVVVLLMLTYRNFGTAAWVYLALHGTYGICWLLKHAVFADPRWETRVTSGGAAFTFIFLGTYWIAPYLLISRISETVWGSPSDALMAVCIALQAFGLTVMMTADCQKRFTLRYRPGLVTEGMFARVRHPNYLGEMIVYSSFALLAGHWLPWLVLAYWWGAVFLVNMKSIEASISRYPEWKAYRARTGMLLPRLRSQPEAGNPG